MASAAATRPPAWKAAALACLAALPTLCQAGAEARAPADLVLTHGTFYTENPRQPWVQALAVNAGTIVYSGDARGARAYVGPATKVVDLHGRFAMPGLVDAHVHPVMGGLKVLYECNFRFSATPDEIARLLSDCAAKAAPGQWIRGGQWDSGFFENHPMASPRAFLDAITTLHPIVLIDDSEHNGWVSSSALKAAGIDEHTPDPAGGTIQRESSGAPNGVLLESAFRVLFRSALPAWTAEQHVAAVREANRLANSYGITAVKDAGAYEDYLAAYGAVDRAGALTMHVAACLRTPSGSRTTPLDYTDLEARRDRYRSTHVHTEFVKIFLDGVPTAARTAAMLAPYLPDAVHQPGYAGDLLVAPALLAQDVTELDRRGFTVKMHATGDRAVRVGLDAIGAARKANGPSGLHHELAHAGYIDAADVPRFAALDAVPDFSPMIWYPSPIIASIIGALGERGRRYWPARDLLDSGARPAGGSDWPAAVPDENPWTGIQALVTRADPKGITPGTLWPEQAIGLAAALNMYMTDAARALKLEARIGSLEPGKSADLIVLDRNPFRIPVTQVAATHVEMTYFEGRLVHGDEH